MAESSTFPRPVLLLGLATLTAATAAALWLGGWLPDAAQILAAIAWLRDSGPVGVALFIAVHTLAILIFFPITPIVFVAGFVWGPVWGTLIMSAGSLLGTTAALMGGRWLMRDWVAARFGTSPHYLAIDRAIAVAGFRAVLLLRSAPIPLAALNYTLSLTRIRVLPYALASVLGLLPLTVLYTSAAGGLAEATAIVEGQVTLGDAAVWLFWAGALAMVAVFTWVARVARRELDRLLATDGPA